jgi:putative endopeptidase
MKNLIRLSAFISFLAGLALVQAPANAQSNNAQPAEPPAIKSFDGTAMDTTVDPCADFYQYACGNWMKNNPIPPDQVRWMRSFLQVNERNRYLLWQELDAAAKHPQTPLQKQYGDFFASCMDTATADKLGASPVQPAWGAIAAILSTSQIPALLADLENHGTPHHRPQGLQQTDCRARSGRHLATRPRLLPRRQSPLR